MAAPSISTNLTRITDSQSTAGWSALGGGGAGLTAETDFYIQNTLCLSKQISGVGTNKGQWFDFGSGIDMSTASGNTCYIWMYMATNQLPDTTALGGLRVRVGSASGSWVEYYVYGSDTYTRGGWKRVAFDCNATANNSGGTYNRASTQFYGGTALVTGTSKGTNFGIDAMDVGSGHIIQAGEAANPANFGNVSVFDDSSTNRYGVFYLQDGTFNQQGRMFVGPRDTSNTVCYTRESSNTINFTSSWVSSNAYGWSIRGANTTLIWNDINMTSLGAAKGIRGDFIMETVGTRGPQCPLYVEVNGGVWDSIRHINLGNTAYFTGATIKASGQISQNSANITSCTIDSPLTTTGILCNDANLVSYTTFISNGSAGHAIQLNSAGEYTFKGNEFQDYSASDAQANSALWNNSGGTVTLNIVDASGSPSVNNSPTSTTIINNSVTLSLEGIVTDSEIRIFSVSTKLPLAGNESITGQVQSVVIVAGGSGYSVSDVLTVVGGTGTAATLTVTSVSGGVITGVDVTTGGDYSVNPTNPASVTGGTGTLATFRLTISGSFDYTYNAVGGQFVNIIVFHLNYKEIRFSNFELPTTSSSIPLQQINDRNYLNP